MFHDARVEPTGHAISVVLEDVLAAGSVEIPTSNWRWYRTLSGYLGEPATSNTHSALQISLFFMEPGRKSMT